LSPDWDDVGTTVRGGPSTPRTVRIGTAAVRSTDPRTDMTHPATDADAVRVDTGRGGLPPVVVRTPAASAAVHHHGAHVTAWAPASHAPVTWTSDHSPLAPGSPLRGGVPVCSVVLTDGEAAVVLPPGRSHRMTATVHVAPLP
jgi:hypothetical protein